MALFDGPTLESPDRRRDYGERRIKAIGRAAGQVLVCVYTDRSAARRIISLRVATGENVMPTVRRTRAGLDLSKVDWQRVAATTDREIAKQIAADPDSAPIFSARELSRAKRVVSPPFRRTSVMRKKYVWLFGLVLPLLAFQAAPANAAFDSQSSGAGRCWS
jgi:Ribonuclease toxin, BrnT, of type II toxin-antitoxin system